MQNTPCLKYRHEKHSRYKKCTFGSFWEEDRHTATEKDTNRMDVFMRL